MNHSSLESSADASPEGVSRRDFLRLVGGTFALAGLSGCVRQSPQQIVPYIDQPERLIPGNPIFYATALELGGFARGVVVETHEGRPTKVEGNVRHPASLGATSVFEQATLLDLYNPARSASLTVRGELSAWSPFLGELQNALSELPPGGAGLHLLTGTITSPTFAHQWKQLRTRYPDAQWHSYEPVNRDAVFDGVATAFGHFVATHFHFEKAQRVVSFGADFLFAMPGSLRYARDLMAGRDIRDGSTRMNRIYMVESVPTITGAYADHRQPVRINGPDGMWGHAAALATRLRVPVSTQGWAPGIEAQRWAEVVANDLKSSAGSPSLVLAGDALPAEFHALVHRMNAVLGSVESGVISYTAPVKIAPGNQMKSLQALATAIQDGSAHLLLMLGGDWAHTAPADLNLESLIRQVPFSVHLGLYRNRTAEAAVWHIPQAHPFEAWSDARAFDGTASIAQPLITPLLGGRTVHEVLDCVARFPGRRSFDIVRDYWRTEGGLAGEAAWRSALHDGVVPHTTAAAVVPKLVSAPEIAIQNPASEGMELGLMPDYSLWDGRFADNAWLQELPRPITRLSWENAIQVSPSMAKAQGWSTGDLVRIEARDGRSVEGAIFVQPGMAAEVLGLMLGAGGKPQAGQWFRGVTGAGAAVEYARTALNTGIDAYPIRVSAEPWSRNVRVFKMEGRHDPVTTQFHHALHGRDLIQTGQWSKLAGIKAAHAAEAPAFYHLTRTMTDGLAWAMAIDLTRCIGCNACTMACQAENNIPPVGQREVARGREMHWLRVDSYFEGDAERPSIAFQPVPCMHCENAPCELVCPVEATLHDHEGLNVQVYNRCIGTRYCSNNCPYKVRRFNFLHYAKPESKPPLELAQNPDVTIRTRGVMEKCTYCVQRITAGRINAEIQKRPILDGEVIPACAQACPTDAIVFGNRNDPASRIAALQRNPFNYALLQELNTQPRTTYLMRITNPPGGMESR